MLCAERLWVTRSFTVLGSRVRVWSKNEKLRFYLFFVVFVFVIVFLSVKFWLSQDRIHNEFNLMPAARIIVCRIFCIIFPIIEKSDLQLL